MRRSSPRSGPVLFHESLPVDRVVQCFPCKSLHICPLHHLCTCLDDIGTHVGRSLSDRTLACNSYTCAMVWCFRCLRSGRMLLRSVRVCVQLLDISLSAGVSDRFSPRCDGVCHGIDVCSSASARSTNVPCDDLLSHEQGSSPKDGASNTRIGRSDLVQVHIIFRSCFKIAPTCASFFPYHATHPTLNLLPKAFVRVVHADSRFPPIEGQIRPFGKEPHPHRKGKRKGDSRSDRGWSCRVSIPVPLACKASALPFELQPHG